MSVKNFISRRNNSYNTVIRGLGSLVDTSGKLSAIINNYGIRNFSLENGGQDIYCNLTSNYSLRHRAFDYLNPEILFDNVMAKDLAPLILSWEDYGGNIVHINSNNAFRGSAIEHIYFPKLKTMGYQDLYDMWNLKTYDLGEITELDLNGFGRDTDLIFDCPSSVTHLVRFSEYNGALITPNSFENVVSIGNYFPFNSNPNIKDLASFDVELLNGINIVNNNDLFYGMRNLEGSYALLGITKLNRPNTFFGIDNITGLDLRNVTEITNKATFWEAGASMEEIDLRSCTAIILSTFNIFNGFKTGCTYHLNSALQDYDGNGTMHPQIQYLISNKNPNIIWY